MESSTTTPPPPGIVRRYWLTFLVAALALGATCVDVVFQIGLGSRDLVFSVKEGHIQLQYLSPELEGATSTFESHTFHFVSPSIGDLPTCFMSESTVEISVPIWLILVLAADWLVLRIYLGMKPTPHIHRSPLEIRGALLNAQVRRPDEEE